MGKGISGRKLAQVLDISHTMVRKYVKRGMPLTSAAAALAWLSANTRGQFSERNVRSENADVAGAEDLEISAEPAASPRDPNAFAGARELEHVSQAELTKRLTAARIKLTDRDAEIRSLQGRQAQMDADLRDGKLLRSEDEHRKGFERAVTLRTKLLGLPAECAVQLAAITDPAMVADFMRKRIKAALIEYCESYGVVADPN